MKKNILINPIGLKGNEINERMISLMGISNNDKNNVNYVIELTKKGPDGKSYAIVRENHEWFIKRTDKTTNIKASDFNYIGGLQNKKDYAYPSYSKAIKQLNFKFKTLAETFNYKGEINLFNDDNLLTEAYTEEDIDDNSVIETESKNNPWAICTDSVGRADKQKYESCVKDVKKKMNMDEMMNDDDINVSENEEYIDEMIKSLTESLKKKL